MAKLKRKQIYFNEESDQALKMLAFATKISEAEHIRRAVRKYIAKLKAGAGNDDPLKELIGQCDSPDGPTDASIRHDGYFCMGRRRYHDSGLCGHWRLDCNGSDSGSTSQAGRLLLSGTL